MEIQRRAYPVEVFTATRKIEGMYQPIGSILDDINSPDKVCIPLSDATFTPLSPNSSLRPVSMPLVVVSKDDLLFLCFKEEGIVEELRLLKRTKRIIVYTSAFALRGDFHLGAEQQPKDMFDTMKGRFQGLTDVTVFPLIDTRVPIPREPKLAMIDIRSVQLYHPEIAS